MLDMSRASTTRWRNAAGVGEVIREVFLLLLEALEVGSYLLARSPRLYILEDHMSY